jgi:SHS2 domain-containing protein
MKNNKEAKVSVPSFRVISHPSDIGIEAWGRDFQKALGEAATALFSIVTDLKTVRAAKTKHLAVAADDEPELVVNWLNELIFITSSQNWLPAKFSIKISREGSRYKLKGTIKGEPINRRRHPLKLEVKAATYNRLAVEKTPDSVRIRVVFDV